MHCVLINVLLWFYNFCENGLKLEKFDFDEFEQINGVVVMNKIEENLCFWLLCFSEESFEKNRVF